MARHRVSHFIFLYVSFETFRSYRRQCRIVGYVVFLLCYLCCSVAFELAATNKKKRVLDFGIIYWNFHGLYFLFSVLWGGGIWFLKEKSRSFCVTKMNSFWQTVRELK